MLENKNKYICLKYYALVRRIFSDWKIVNYFISTQNTHNVENIT
jgi:hypothetical protein